MASKADRGMGSNRVVFEGPGGEGGDEAGGQEGVVGEGGGRGRGRGREVGGDEAEGGVVGPEVEEVVGVGLAFGDYSGAGAALGYVPP